MREQALMLILSLSVPLLVTGPLMAAPPLIQRTPYHSAADVIAKPRQVVALEAWFSRGAWVQKDVDEATVSADIQIAGAWKSLGQAKTDDAGRAVIHCEAPEALGAYSIRWSYKNQEASGALYVIKGDEAATVFDIDGTLSPSDGEIFKDYARRLVRNPSLKGPRLRKNALLATRQASKAGLVIYLTGRPTWLGSPTRQWLKANGFPEGPVFWMAKTGDIWPDEAHVGRGKIERLQALKALGITFKAAYGNAPTDILAYATVGIPKAQTYILGKHGGKDGTVALGEAFSGSDQK